jgi:hypothetical protein
MYKQIPTGQRIGKKAKLTIKLFKKFRIRWVIYIVIFVSMKQMKNLSVIDVAITIVKNAITHLQFIINMKVVYVIGVLIKKEN